MFTDLFPVVGSYIWIFIVLITMASKHISSALIPQRKQNKTVSSLLSNLLRNASVKVGKHGMFQKSENSFQKVDSISDLIFLSEQAGIKVYHKSWCDRPET